MPNWSVQDIYDLAKSMVGPSTAEAMPLPTSTREWRRALTAMTPAIRKGVEPGSKLRLASTPAAKSLEKLGEFKPYPGKKIVGKYTPGDITDYILNYQPSARDVRTIQAKADRQLFDRSGGYHSLDVRSILSYNPPTPYGARIPSNAATDEIYARRLNDVAEGRYEQGRLKPEYILTPDRMSEDQLNTYYKLRTEGHNYFDSKAVAKYIRQALGVDPRVNLQRLHQEARPGFARYLQTKHGTPEDRAQFESLRDQARMIDRDDLPDEVFTRYNSAQRDLMNNVLSQPDWRHVSFSDIFHGDPDVDRASDLMHRHRTREIRERGIQQAQAAADSMYPPYTPEHDLISRLQRKLQQQPTMTKKEFEGAYPGASQRYAGMVNDLFKRGKLTYDDVKGLTIPQVEDSLLKYDFTPASDRGYFGRETSYDKDLPRYALRMSMDPSKLSQEARELDYGHHHGWMTKEGSKPVGWLDITQPNEDTWIVEEAQSDLRRQLKGSNMRVDPKVSEELRAGTKDWIKQAYASALKEARDRGIKHMYVMDPALVSTQEIANPGIAKLSELYVDPPKQLGFQTAELPKTGLSPWGKKHQNLLKGLYRVPALAGLGVFGTSLFDDADAVTPNQFWTVAKAAGYKNLPRSTQAQVARSLRNLPKNTLDKISDVFPEFNDPNARAVLKSQMSYRAIPGMPPSMALDTRFEGGQVHLGSRPDQVYPTAPTHEGLHGVWMDMPPEDKIPFFEQWMNRRMLSPGHGNLDDVGTLFGSNLSANPSELFAEYGAHRLQKTPAYQDFARRLPPIAQQFDDILRKYTKYGLPAALLTAMGAGALAPDEASAGPRADALRAALRGPLYHGSSKADQIAAEGPKLASDSENQAFYVTDRSPYASQYTDTYNDREAPTGAGVNFFHLDPSTKVKVLRHGPNTYYFSKEEAKKYLDQGYDAVTQMPSMSEINNPLVPTGLGSSELAVLNPKKLLPGKGAIAAALGLGAYAGSSDKAEAMPIGKLSPMTKQAPGLIRSEDAFYRLLGHKLRGTHEVVDVLRNPKNDWRYIVAKDANGNYFQLPMTKDYLNVYSGAKGTQDYLQRFEQEGYRGKQLQALKSLTRRETTRDATSFVPEMDFRAWNKGQMEKAREIDPSLVNDYAYVKILDDKGSGPKGQSLYMPRPYADFLARKGYVKILKR